LTEKLAINGGEPAAPMKIPIAKPIFTEEAIEEVADVIRSGYLRQGPKTKQFEEEFAEFVGSKYAYAVSNGTAALHLAYMSLLEHGDEVIVPAFTFIATAATVHYTGCTPIFADVDPDTYMIDPEDVKEKITPKTKAIVPVHLFGNAADLNTLAQIAHDHTLHLIGDSAQAHGTKYASRDIGSLGTLNSYSFYPSKTMSTGEGGMVTTNSQKLYDKGCLLRAHGDDARYHHVVLGLNYRITDMASTLGLHQLKELPNWLNRRKRIGEYLHDKIMEIEGLKPQETTPNAEHSYSYFTLTLDPEQYNCTRDQFIGALEAENISAAVHYPLSLTEQPIIKEKYNPPSCPVSEQLSKTIFSLPMHTQLTQTDLENIVKGVEKVASHFHK